MPLHGSLLVCRPRRDGRLSWLSYNVRVDKLDKIVGSIRDHNDCPRGGGVTTTALGPTTADRGPTPSLQFPPLSSLHVLGAGVTNLNEPPSSFFLLPPHCCGLVAGSIPIKAIVNNKQCDMRGLYCVVWGVKLYSLTHPSKFPLQPLLILLLPRCPCNKAAAFRIPYVTHQGPFIS